MSERAAIFDAVRAKAKPGIFNDPGHVHALDNLLDAFGVPVDRPAPIEACTRATEACLLELLEHEAIVREAYKDSVGVWTWSAGVTNASGHHVDRYRDNPQTIAKCLTVFCWLVNTKYLPQVLRAFEGYPLKEHELAAALSFNWNTEAIGRADWVKSVKRGDRLRAWSEFLNWHSPASIIPRRKAERALFFDGTWSHDGRVLVLPVSKPSYTPGFGKGELLDIRDELRVAMDVSG